jgi:hypothetical protein
MEKIDIIFEKVKNGKITPDEARMQVLFLSKSFVENHFL